MPALYFGLLVVNLQLGANNQSMLVVYRASRVDILATAAAEHNVNPPPLACACSGCSMLLMQTTQHKLHEACSVLS